jgi:hypothetical protein
LIKTLTWRNELKALFLLIVVSSTTSFANASTVNLIGDYSAPAAIRFFDYTAADCRLEDGELTDGACIILSSSNVSIQKNDKQQTIVKINVIYGPANMRDFSGVVTKTVGNTLQAAEANIDDNNNVVQIEKHGCRMTVSLKGNSLKLGASAVCDSNLLRADGAKRN